MRQRKQRKRMTWKKHVRRESSRSFRSSMSGGLSDTGRFCAMEWHFFRRRRWSENCDLLKFWNAMMDDNAIYIILGAELQGKVHYGMPVKDGLYDMIGYSNCKRRI